MDNQGEFEERGRWTTASSLSVVVLLVLSVGGYLTCSEEAPKPAFRDQVVESLHKATEFFRTRVSTHGGYLWRYSKDLVRREGEREATATMVWVQPPGTPSVGMAFLRAYEATGDQYYLDAARETAHALVRGQLRSGGWDYHIEFDPNRRKEYAYRVDKHNEDGRNVSTLDDDTTQAALRLLMRVDHTLEFKDKGIHEAVLFGLETLIKTQYPNGAWPQRYSEPPDSKKFPVKRAAYPPTWFRGQPGEDYRGYYTINDNTITDTIHTTLEAARIYDQPGFRRAAEKAGRFILLAQMPEPQPAWAQQYDAHMYPAWARKFEPPAVTGGESQGIMRTLMYLYRETGDKKYLQPLPRAIAYLRRSVLPDGRLARFYELKTNKPLFFTRDYQLTYSDADLPTHYSFKIGNDIESIAQDYQRLVAGAAPKKSSISDSQPSDKLMQRASEVLATLDEEGRWVRQDQLRANNPNSPEAIIDCETFIRNVDILTSYLMATHGSKPKQPIEKGLPMRL